MLRRLLLSLGIVLAFSPALLAQISEGGEPYSFSEEFQRRFGDVKVPLETLPPVDLEAIRAEDESDGFSNRFAVPVYVNYNLENSGTWQEMPNGDRVWRLKIHSNGAETLHAIYDDFYIPTGAKFFIYSEDKTQKLGAFTYRNNKPYRSFNTWFLRTETIVLEYFEPKKVRGAGTISVERVDHGYRSWGFVKEQMEKGVRGFGASGSCNNNVNCCPIGNDWQDEKRGVGIMMSSTAAGSGFCSGSLINNTNFDGTPYFLTADHCASGATAGATVNWVFLFNYEAPGCANPASDPYPSPVNTSISGGTCRAQNGASDFFLVELSATPPASFNVYYNGWNRENVASPSSMGIHHPSGDIKKITESTNPLTSSAYGGAPGSGDSHWRVVWTDGTTEGGSSGSPIFNQDADGKIVGQLHGGGASCSSLTAPDYYGKIARSWADGGTAGTQLQNWLDPTNSGVLEIGGYDPNGSVGTPHAANFDGTNDFINLTGAPKNATFTLELWVKPNANANATLFSWGNATESAALRLNASGQLEYTETAGGAATSTASIPTGTWTHVAVTKTGTTASLFINGAADGTGAVTNIGAPTAATLGARNQGVATLSEHFNGLLDEVRLWNVTRSAAQLAGDMHTDLTAAAYPGSLTNVWHLDTGGGTTATGGTGGVNGTFQNGTAWADLGPVFSAAVTGPSGSCLSSSTGPYTVNFEGCGTIGDDTRMNYNWTVTGGTIASGQGTPSITVNWGGTPTTGTVQVTASYSNNSGSVSSSNFDVVVDNSSPTVPTVSASGPTSFCGSSVDLTVTNLTPNTYALSSITHAPETFTGTNVTLGDDDSSPAIPMGFSFDYFGNTYTNVYIGSNGIVGFTDVSMNSRFNDALPNNGDPSNMVALAWDDLNPNSGGTISYATLGTAPNRRFVVEFNNVPHFGNTNTVHAQVVFYEGSGIIDIHNINVNDDGGTMTQGIENDGGTVGFPVAGHNSTAWSAAAESWRFTPTVSGLVWQPTGETTMTITVNDAGAGSYTATYSPTGGCAAVSAPVVVSTSCAGPPTITSPTHTSVLANSATLGANVTSDGGSALTAMGVVWSTSPNPTIGGAGVTNVAHGTPGTGIFTVGATGLPASTTIYYRGYATNANGTVYTVDGSFTTPAGAADVTAPTYVTLNPFDGALGVSTTPTISVTFDENIQGTAGGTLEVYDVATGTLVQSFSLAAISGTSSISFNITSTLNFVTDYYVIIPAGSITDMSGNAFTQLTGTTDWVFTTRVAPTSGGGSGSGTSNRLYPAEGIYAIAQDTATIELRWRDRSTNEQGYYIYRAIEGGAYVLHAIVPGDAGAGAWFTYIDTDLDPDTQYHYFVRAYRGTEQSTHSDQAEDITYPLPPTLNAGAICYNSTATLTAVAPHISGEYRWYDSDTTQTPILAGSGNAYSEAQFTTPQLQQSVTYWVSAVGRRYESFPRVGLTVDVLPEVTASLTLAESRHEVCEDRFMLEALNPLAGQTFQWYFNGQAIAGATSASYEATQDGSYSLRAFDGTTGCGSIRTDAVYIDLEVKPNFFIEQGTRTDFCETGTLSANDLTGASYAWEFNGNALGNARTQDVSESGTYTLRATLDGCEITRQIDVNVRTFPTDLTLSGAASGLCPGETTTLNAPVASGAEYVWMKDGRTFSRTDVPTLEVTAQGEYSVYLTYGNCEKLSANSINVQFVDVPQAVVRRDGDFLRLRIENQQTPDGISWFLDDVLQPAFDGQVEIQPSQEGFYRAELNFSGCSRRTGSQYYFQVVTNLEDDKALDFRIFPNPMHDLLRIQLPSGLQGELEVEIHDALGRTLLTKRFSSNANEVQLNTSFLTQGAYMLRLKAADGQTQWHKLIKE